MNLSCIVVMFFASLVPHPDVSTIIQKSVEANLTDWNAAPSYDYLERDRESGGSRTYDEKMIYGSPYERLIAINYKALSANQQAAEQEKLDAVISHRRRESSEQRARRIADYDRQRKRDYLLMDQMTKAFDFTWLGEQKMGGFDVYVLKATPKASYEPPNLEAQVLRGMEGKLWIDVNTFQWVKVEARVIHPVSIAGFLARVEPGTRFELEKMPVTNSVWLPQHFAVESHAKILFFVNHSTVEDDSYFSYQPTPSN